MRKGSGKGEEEEGPATKVQLSVQAQCCFAAYDARKEHPSGCKGIGHQASHNSEPLGKDCADTWQQFGLLETKETRPKAARGSELSQKAGTVLAVLGTVSPG